MSSADSSQRYYSREEWRSRIVAAIREATDDGAVDIGGGVSTAEISERIPERRRKIVGERAHGLAKAGVLERQSGIAYDMMRPRPSYCIAEGGEEMEVST